MKPTIHTTLDRFQIGIRAEDHVHILEFDTSVDSAELLSIYLAANFPWFKLSYESVTDILGFYVIWLVQTLTAEHEK